jgi:hypothetical protein
MVGGIVRDGTIGTDVIIRTMQTLVAGGQDGKCPALVAVIVVGLLGGRFRTIGTLTQQLVHDSRLELVHQVKQLVHVMLSYISVIRISPYIMNINHFPGGQNPEF